MSKQTLKIDETEQEKHLDPFGGDCDTYEVTSLISVSRLQEEIIAKVGDDLDVQVVLSVDDYDHVASKDHPALLFVHPKRLDGRTVRAIINAHVPKPVVPVVGRLTPKAIVSPEMTEVIDKLSSGKTLSTAEISSILRALVQH